MKIVIDARMYGVEHAGIGRYVENLLRELKGLKTKKGKNINFYLLVRRRQFNKIRKTVDGKFEIIITDVPHYSFKEQLFLPLQLIKLKPNLVHFPHFNVPLFYPGKFVVTIHDLIKHTSRGLQTTTHRPWFYWLKYLGYRVVFAFAVKRAAKILVPSMTVKNELVRTYHLPEEKIVVTYEGISKKFQISNFKFQIVNKILRKYKIRKPFVIYTGSLYPHKNIERLAAAVKCFNDLNHDNKKLFLVIVCARNIFYERFTKKIKKMDGEKLVNLIGFVPDEELAILYQIARAFIFPSLSEGFGLPGLEAMACGLPVVCSNISVFREIYGEAAEYFDPLDINDMAQKIGKVCFNDLNYRNRLIKKGFQQVKRYSWQKMAKETLEIYNHIILRDS